MIKVLLWFIFLYAFLFIIMYVVASIVVRFSKKKDFRRDVNKGIISSNDNLAMMSWYDMIKYDFDRNIPYLVNNFGGIIFNGLYTIGHTIVRTVWYTVQLVGLAGTIVYRSIVVPRNARAAIRSYTVKSVKGNKAKRKK